MTLTLRNLDTHLKKPSSLYFIMGSEIFLIQESLKKIQSQVLSTEFLDFNFQTFAPENTSKIREAVETLPVFSDKRMVVVESAHHLKESHWKALQPILNPPVETCVLVFVSSEPDKRKKIIKELCSVCEVISAEPPRQKDWPSWVEWMGKKEGVAFSNSAVQLMQEYTCSDLKNLHTEVKKLRSLVGEGATISAEDVLKTVPRVRQEDIFALSKAIGRKNLPSALLCLVRLLEDNQSEVGILALISRHIRILARIKEGLKKGHSEQTLCRKTGVPYFFMADYIQSANLWPEKKIFSVMEMLKSVDKALKSSPLSSHIWLENFIIKTCSL